MASQLRHRLHHLHGIEITAGRLLGAQSVADLGETLTRSAAATDRTQ
jgi:hypothetical protein